ncbi:MAG: carboxypeptidase regulatory-like domain-containing protein [Terriglobales bacterium]
MKSRYRVAAIAVSVLLLAAVMLRSTPEAGAAATGQVFGTVKLDGPIPHQKPIDMSKDPSCAETRSGASAVMERVVVGANGGLANAVVYISQGLSGTEPASTQAVRMEQKGCQYVPHVVAVNPGQHMTVVNDDKTLHNIHPDPKPGGGNVPWNKSQLVGSPAIDVAWTNEEVAIPVKCNIHPWMRAYIVVVKGPTGVSNDTGSFKLEGVLPGAYTLTAWHETYGTQTQKITVAAGKAATADFTFKAK